MLVEYLHHPYLEIKIHTSSVIASVYHQVVHYPSKKMTPYLRKKYQWVKSKEMSLTFEYILV